MDWCKSGESATLAILEMNGKWEGIGKKFKPFDGGGAEGSSGKSKGPVLNRREVR